METEYKTGQDFKTLAHRIIFAYLCTIPAFIPVSTLPIGIESQRQLHEFLYSSIKKIFEDPNLVSIRSTPDEYYQDNEFQYTNPKLLQRMMAVDNKLVRFYDSLRRIGNAGELKADRLIIPKSDLRLTAKTWLNFEKFGLISALTTENRELYSKEFPKMFPAWKYLSAIEVHGTRNQMISFLRGNYSGKEYSALQLFEKVITCPELLQELEVFFQEKGYRQKIENLNVFWLREYCRKERGQMTVSFNWQVKDQIRFEFRIPHFRKNLEFFDSMDSDLQDLVFHRLRKCSGCRYCVQYDTSGKKKLIHVSLSHQGEKQIKCPLFAYFTWKQLTPEIVDQVKRLYQFTER
jgi:hypothetical protein